MSLTLDALASRHSTPTRQLDAPGPDDAQLLQMLDTAVRVPDHGKRVPFRFLRITGAARTTLADAAEGRLREREPDAGEAVIDKLRSRFTTPPLTLAVIANTGPDEKIPATERFSSAACVCFQLLQAAHAVGFGAQWLTGWIAYDRPFLEGVLGLDAEEQLVGTIAIGTPRIEVPDRPRPDPAELLADWLPR
ncbi:MAG: nitroreductase [Proteobacteria bacterium]|nr:nitroreductase [Pseudomonadota bacterium]